MRVTYTRRLGQHPAGSTRTHSPAHAHWLIRRGLAHTTETPPETAAEPPTPNTPPEDTPETRSLAGLKAEADSYGLPTYGTKAQLAARIADHLA